MAKTDSSEKTINILVLGETGVGKSTFINAFANYMQFHNLNDAVQKNEITCLIPSSFVVTDENFKERRVYVGNDKNEDTKVGASATQGAKSYVFPIAGGLTKIRMIDTPGIGDTRGIEQDNANFENIISYLDQFDELHGICILLKPNNARLTVLFEFCVKQLLSRLEKSASRNIIFIFTNSRSTFYRPGDTLPPLKEILKTIKEKPPFVEIPCEHDNIFCMDNEAFRFLVSIQNNISFTKKEKQDFSGSWTSSSEECWRLIRYIAGDSDVPALPPHRIKDTVSINRARQVILKLSQPLAEIAQMICDNLTLLKRHKNDLKRNVNNLDELKSKLYMPVVNLKVEELPQPRTVCTSKKCCQVVKVDDRNQWHYSTRCHDPCYLQNVPREIVGSPELVSCWAIDANTKKCKKCSCDFSAHMHIYFQTELVSEKIVDKNVDSQIKNEETALKELEKHVEKMNKRRDKYELEKHIIVKSTAKFAHFLQHNAITPYNDSYEAYIEYLIDREQSLGKDANKENINHLKMLLNQYNEEKHTLNTAMQQSASQNLGDPVTPDSIFDTMQVLYSLEYTGSKIEELFNKQSRARGSENEHNTEYVHPHSINTSKHSKNKDKKNNTGIREEAKQGKIVSNKNGGKKFADKQDLQKSTKSYGSKHENLSRNSSTNQLQKRSNQQSHDLNSRNDNYNQLPSLLDQVTLSGIKPRQNSRYDNSSKNTRRNMNQSNNSHNKSWNQKPNQHFPGSNDWNQQSNMGPNQQPNQGPSNWSQGPNTYNQGPNNWNQQPNQGPNNWNQQPNQAPNNWNQQPNQGPNNWNQQPNNWNQQPNQGPNNWSQQPNQGPNNWNQQPNQGPSKWNQQPNQGPGNWNQQPNQEPSNWNQQPNQGPNNWNQSLNQDPAHPSWKQSANRNPNQYSNNPTNFSYNNLHKDSRFRNNPQRFSENHHNKKGHYTKSGRDNSMQDKPDVRNRRHNFKRNRHNFPNKSNIGHNIDQGGETDTQLSDSSASAAEQKNNDDGVKMLREKIIDLFSDSSDDENSHYEFPLWEEVKKEDNYKKENHEGDDEKETPKSRYLVKVGKLLSYFK